MMKSLPDTLFKYRTVDQAIKIMGDLNLAFSAPGQFNDPFDSHVAISYGYMTDEYDDKFSRILMDDMEGKTDLVGTRPSYREALKGYRKWHQANPNEDLYNFIKNHLSAQKKRNSQVPAEDLKTEWADAMKDSRVFCSAERFDNDLMWSHYSDSHKGAVLGFRSNLWQHLTHIELSQVTYSKKPPLFGSEDDWISYFRNGKLFDLNSHTQNYLSLKDDKWSYEEEWRYRFMLKQGTGRSSTCTLEPIDGKDLKEIYLGLRMEDAKRQEIIHLVRSKFPHMKILKASTSSAPFELVFTAL